DSVGADLFDQNQRNEGFCHVGLGAQGHMGCWGINGTVQVRGSVRERAVGVMGVLAGNSVVG
nr:hypothetical protein [Tanacetum cinerariifolium]